MLEWLSMGFMQYALIAGIVTSIVCAIVGVFVILRGMSFMGAGIAHAAFAGAAFGILIGGHPLIYALIFSISISIIVVYTSEKGGLRPDVSIGILFSLTMALAIFFIGFMESYTQVSKAMSFLLFGSVLSVTYYDLMMIVIMGIVIIILMKLFYKEFKIITFDQEIALAMGIPVVPLNYLLLILISIAIVTSIQTVGAILVFALITAPPAAAHQLTHRMSIMFILSILFGTSSCILGLIASYYLDLPTSAVIASIAAGIFFICLFISPKRRREIKHLKMISKKGEVIH